MKQQVETLLQQTIETLTAAGTLPEADVTVAVSIPQNKQFGDYATNVAMTLASAARRAPRDIAADIVAELEKHELFDRVEIAGPGFINLAVKNDAWLEVLRKIHSEGDAFGTSDYGRDRKVQVEYVSANPTGPLHVGHGRGAALGDSLVRLLRATGHDVQAEYYINNVGNQMNVLGRSVLERAKELKGREIEFPENAYQGDYIKDLAAEMLELHDDLLAMDEAESIPLCRTYAAEKILESIRVDLEEFNVHFDHWFPESSLYEDDRVNHTLAELQDKKLIYEDDGALWFASSRFGDEKDRVVKKQDGALTYFAPDIAYHRNKIDRGFTQLIDIWGADHHGYVPRMTAAIEALGADPSGFHALLIQMVSLVREGQPVYMSTRAGEFITLKEIVDEVGADAARYFFLMRKYDSQLVFDLELAKKKSEENPVFYIQYAHARICSIIRNAAEQGFTPDAAAADLSRLENAGDLDLIKQLAIYPDMLVGAARDLEPHRISFYLLDLATAFHSFYNKNRVISDDSGLTIARLVLIDAVRQVIANALGLLGISAPTSM